jgi:hypothetical protein
MRLLLPAALALFVLSSSPAVHADPSNLPSPGDRTVGLGLTATGIALTGAGGYFIYRSQQDDHTPSEGKLAIALTAGGIIATASGLVLWLSEPPTSEKKPKRIRRSALIITPASAWYRLEL